MDGMTLSDVVLATNGTFYGDKKDLQKEITGITIDSRQVEEGNLFIAIKGERVDGHDFIPAIRNAGAVASVCERQPDSGMEPYVLVDSTLQAIKDIARYYRSNMPVKVIGVSGSVGKTSAKEMIASVLSEKHYVLKTIGNFNNEIGMPLTLFRLTREHEAAVVEMGISDFGEMHRLSQIARPDICVITNIGQCHLDKLGDRDGVYRAKSEMFEFLPRDGIIILNGDDDILSRAAMINGIRPLFFGLGHQNDIYAENIVPQGLEKIYFEIVIPSKNERFRVELNQPGRHMIYNALAAAAVGMSLGLKSEQIKRGIEKNEKVKGRVNIIQTDKWTIIDDCYNANPVSMKASLDLLAEASGRKVAILGDMLELGKDEEILHKEVGSYLAEKGIDLLLCSGRLSRQTYEGAGDGLSKYYFETREEMMRKIPVLLKPTDTILIKASHGMHFEKIVLMLETDC
ncbi:UDP-N-acetylmuramoyl-tripeptide--D-alanyl-D-alanine ligase [Parasporobacterium paucivorans]|uniref:UDP-N-acetylmuramoyl-tripeptide--D-alanyl-D-alanine ligase n=1 Tax=Parasporobacterium paucivorans DSM 15970 TaxID=1122934 RepID=A0A1M6ADP1_9FIRM|nr:UDP-N-acetylmuramoyl-tripeptide--D-alanyl-D-alanine ligase [Parasporobacterium paucivorans]SHI34531.1 UDP-N-acetylmuramoyl-tripeptide--D-alanyl-D-alanine ligase [Parasporobacterium paucivorans DSM 15970]